MKKSSLIEKLKEHKEFLNKDLTDEQLQQMLSFIKSVKDEQLRELSLEELKELNSLISSIIERVKTLQNSIIKDIENQAKKQSATRAYLKNEILNDR